MSEPLPSRDDRRATVRLAIVAALGAIAVGVSAFVGLRQWVPAPAAPDPAQTATGVRGTDAAIPTFDIVRVSPRGGAVIAGHAPPGAEVRIDESEHEIGRVQANQRGDFVFVPTEPLPPGPKSFTLVVRMPDGREFRSPGAVMAVVPDRPTEQAPVAVLAIPDRPLQVLQSAPGDGQSLGLDAAAREEDGTMRLAGRAPPGTTVRVYVDDHLSGDAKADEKGTWTLTTVAPPAAGEHQVRVDQLETAGRVAARALAPLPTEAATAALATNQVVVQPGQTLWRMARAVYGSGQHYTLLYQANREQIRDPNRIYPGQTFEVPAPPPDNNGLR